MVDSIEKQIAELSAKELRDAFLSLKQGEALERNTFPRLHKEGLGLGFYGPETVLTLNALDLLEDVINELAYNPTVTEKIFDEEGKEIGTKVVEVDMIPAFRGTLNALHKFTEGIGVASGSRNATRLIESLKTIGTLGQYSPAARGEGAGEEPEASQDD